MLLNLLIITPRQKVFTGTVTLLSVVTTAGQIGVLANHTPLISIVKTGPLHLIIEGKTTYYATSGGVISVQKDETILLLDAIEKAEEIDITRAKDALRRAEERLKEANDKIDEARAQAALSRALNRIQVAEEHRRQS
jgi:F-type H+-transporting ATPase subunit epsilon